MKQFLLATGLAAAVASLSGCGTADDRAASKTAATANEPSAAISSALDDLVGIFGTNIGPAAIYGNAVPASCKIYVNFLDNGAASPTPGARVSIEHISLIFVTARADFTGFLGGITPLLAAERGDDGSITLHGAFGSKLTVARAANGRPLVTVNGLSCTAETRLLF